MPVLLATGLFFGTNTPSLPTPPLLSRLHLPLNLCTATSLTYSTLYLLLSPNPAGLSTVPLLVGGAALANRIATHSSTSTSSTSTLNAVAVGVHAASWVLQFVGHGRFEGRKPALVDNLVQAVVLAPLFVWYEVLFRLGFCGGLRREVEGGRVD